MKNLILCARLNLECILQTVEAPRYAMHDVRYRTTTVNLCGCDITHEVRLYILQSSDSFQANIDQPSNLSCI